MPFAHEKLVEVGRRIVELYPSEAAARVRERVTPAVLDSLARGVAGALGGKVGIAPRIFLKRLVGLLDQVDEHPDFDPSRDFALVVEANEMTDEERGAAGVSRTVDDIALELDAGGGRDLE